VTRIERLAHLLQDRMRPVRAEVRGELQMRAVAQRPAGVHQFVALDLEATRRSHTAKPWRDVHLAYAETFAIELAPLAMARIPGFAPDELAAFECHLVVWIGDGRL